MRPDFKRAIALLAIAAFGLDCKFPSRSNGLEMLLLVNLLSAPIYSLPDTGQTSCYDDSTTQSCSSVTGTHPRQDGLVSKPTTYSISQSGNAVTSAETSLLWERCSAGQTWNGATCAGTVTDLSKSGAVTYCTALATEGRTWRVPSLRELLTLPNQSVSSPAIDSTYFPGVPTGSRRYWTTDSDLLTAGNSWTVDFSAGTTQSVTDSIASFTHVRCVSGSLPSASFSDNGDGTITDNVLRLVWTKCLLDNAGTPLPHASNCSGTSGLQTWSSALTKCANLSLGGRTWRLPDQTEVHSLLDVSRSAAPLINPAYFPANGSVPVQSSTTNILNGAQQRATDFSTGTLTVSTKVAGTRFRCVSGP